MSAPVLASGEQPVPAGNGPGGHSPAFPPRLLTDLLDRAMRVYGDRIAIDFLGRRWTYSELGVLVERAARGLQDIGVKPGDRVGLCLPNTHYYVVLYFATLRVGGIVVNLNPLYVERELCHLLKDSGTSVVVTCDLPPIHTKVAKVAADVGVRRLVVCSIGDALPTWKSIAYKLFKRKDIAHLPRDAMQLDFATLIASRAPRTPVALDPDDVAVLQYTGGTTGEPKAAMLTHANLAVSSAQMIEFLGHLPEQQERTMGVLPLFHVFALTTVLNFSIDTGTEMVLLPRFDLHQMVDTIARTRCTQLFAVPTIYGAMNGLPDKDLAKLKSLKFSISGGAPLPFDVRQRFEAAHRRACGRGLWPVGSLADHHLQPDRRRHQGQQCRRALPRNGDRDPRPRRSAQDSAHGRAWRDLRARAAGDEGLLEPPRRHRGGVRRWRAAHRRCRLSR